MLRLLMRQGKLWEWIKMADFKCIGCGEVRDMKKQCGCPVCGYTMYATPYHKSEKLKSEMIRFIELVINKVVTVDDIYFKGKQEDECRFPDYDTILHFVNSSKTTEKFCENLKRSLVKIREHLHTGFQKSYIGNLKNIQEESENREGQLTEIMKEFGFEFVAEKLALQPVKLDYSEIPDEILLDVADVLLDELEALTNKISQFIKLNNIYGNACGVYPKTPKIPKKIDWEKHLNETALSLDSVIAKKYFVDIFDDGQEQFEQMLTALWNGIYLLMSAPVLRKSSVYAVGVHENLTEKECLSELTKLISERFELVTQYVHDEKFLSDKTEEQLFELYNAMLDLDWDGLMKLSKGEMKVGFSEKKLEKLIGLNSIKNSIQKIKAFALANKGSENLNLHMCFYGNPGTGKTEVAVSLQAYSTRTGCFLRTKWLRLTAADWLLPMLVRRR